MSIICPSCGQETPEGFPRCANCGAPLAAEQGVAREERKVVTVLFCDLVGSTARAEGADPEDVRALLSAYHERVRHELERFGGTVEKFIGDAVMALFGAPTTHEDDPERAVRAALAIRDWAAEDGDLQVRIGITTGEALVTLGARPEAGEGMASGDVVNTAARLQSAAPVNGILVDETTFRATTQAISFGEREPVEASGKAEPVDVWEATEARASLGLDVVRAARTPLVGRSRELEVLSGALARVREERRPQLVTLVGVPGIGKSRLVYELLQVVEQDPELIYWRQGRSLPYGEGVSYWALAEMVKAHAGVLETDSAEQTQEKLRSVVGETIAEAADARWVEGHLRPLVGLEGEGEAHDDRRGEAFAAWRRFLEALAETSPMVLVFEDLHWADDGLLDFVDELVEWTSGVPMLVVGTTRPELLSRRPGWGGGKANATTVSLAPLPDDDTARLLAVLLDQPVIPAETQQMLLARAGGNPLYAEQYARMLAERGADEHLELPETIQGIIAARLDALPPDEKGLLQSAAVVGKVFWTGALTSIGGDATPALAERLHALERREFVRRERRSSVAAETEYAFQHVLVRDVAYGQIPRQRRAEMHRAAAEWIESLASDRTEDRAEMLAHHYLSALEYARSSGQPLDELSQRARPALRDAGDRALALNAFEAAQRFYASAVELSSEDDRERPRLLFRLAQAFHYTDDVGRVERFSDAREALLASGDVDGAVEADAFLAEAWWHRGMRDRAFEHLDSGRALVEELGASIGKARILSQISRYRMLASANEEAVRVGEEALEMAAALGRDDLRAHALISIGTARHAMGNASGVAEVERGLEVALAAKIPDAISRGYTNLAALAGLTGDIRRAGKIVDDAIATSEGVGDHGGARFLRGEQISHGYGLGDWDRCLLRANAFIAECEAGSPHYQESGVRQVRARIRFARGDEERAREDLQAALALAREAKDPQALFPVLADCIELEAERGALDEANRFAQELFTAPGQDWVFLGPEVTWGARRLGRADELRNGIEAAARQTRWHEAALAVLKEDFLRAAGIYSEIGHAPAEARARLLAAKALIAQGRRTEADAELQRALAFFRSVGATRYVGEGEALLAESA